MKLFVVHPIPSKGNLHRASLCILAKMPLPGFLITVEDDIRRTQCVENRPVSEILDGVVWTIITTPALDAKKISPLIEIMIEEFETGLGVGAQKLSFQQSPGRRGYGSINHHLNLTSC